MRVDELRISIKVDDDWIALNLYRMVLERIAKEAGDGALAASEFGELARSVLSQFPGGFRV